MCYQIIFISNQNVVFRVIVSNLNVVTDLDYHNLFIIDGPLSVLKKKYESNELKHDDHQLKIAQELQRIYEQAHTYNPPDIIPTSSNENVLTKWLPFMNQPNNKLDPSKRLQGLYIYGSVGGGKTMLMDMFFDCCENVRNNRLPLIL